MKLSIFPEKISANHPLCPWILEGGFETEAATEKFEDEAPGPAPVIDEVDKELGRGKRSKQPNRLYCETTFWQHNDSDSSDAEDLYIDS